VNASAVQNRNPDYERAHVYLKIGMVLSTNLLTYVQSSGTITRDTLAVLGNTVLREVTRWVWFLRRKDEDLAPKKQDYMIVRNPFPDVPFQAP
jgi:hypothetical protein